MGSPRDERAALAGETQGPNLLTLGVGGGSKNERIKSDSAYLRGDLADELAQDAPRLSEPQAQLLKFHGSYQQEDRDVRLAIHQSGGAKAYQFMVRSRIPGGELTAAQYLAEDAIACAYGNGTLRITTRQGLQLHGILKGDLRASIHAINAALLSTLAACGDVNRNVMACPAPSATRGQAEIQRIAHELAERFSPRTSAYHELWIDGEHAATVGDVEPLYGPTYLPRKFKIGVAYPGDNCVDVYTQDIGLVAEMDGDDLRGFTLLIGGGMGATHGKSETYPRLASPFAFVRPEQVGPVCEAILTIQRDYGDRQNRRHARMKYLVQERGVAWFRAEAARRLGYSLPEPHAVTFTGADDHLGWGRQADGNWYLGLSVENGRIADSADVRLRTALRRVMERFAPGVRLTGQQNILLTDIPTRLKGPLAATLARYDVIVDPERLGALRLAMACPALPTCGLALAEAERALPSLIRAFDAEAQRLGLAAQAPSVRMTGCPNGCARPHMAEIGIVGRSKDLYNISLGGDIANTRLNTLYAENVRSADLLPTLTALLRRWAAERLAGERFGDYCQRVGIERLRAWWLASRQSEVSGGAAESESVAAR